MADLSMCKWELCPKSSSCHRFLAFPDTDQVYMKFQNICRQDNQWKWFWEAKTEIIDTDNK